MRANDEALCVPVIMILYNGSLFIKRSSVGCHNSAVAQPSLSRARRSHNGAMSAINETEPFIAQFVLYNRRADVASITRHATRQFARAAADQSAAPRADCATLLSRSKWGPP